MWKKALVAATIPIIGYTCYVTYKKLNTNDNNEKYLKSNAFPAGVKETVRTIQLQDGPITEVTREVPIPVCFFFSYFIFILFLLILIIYV